MALVKVYNKIIFGKELTFDEAYYKVAHISGDKEKIEAIVEIYDTEEKENLVGKKLFVFTPSTDNESANFIKQTYEYMKALPEFEGAIDVLEDDQVV